MAALYDDNFKHVARAALSGSSAQAYFKVQGYPGYPVIISRFEYSASEKVQVVEAFKEYIHLYSFGRAASQVQIQGYCLNIGDDFSGSVPPLKTVYQQQLRAFKAAQGGGMVSIVGPIGVLKGVAVNMSFSISSGQDSLMNFAMAFIVLDGTSESSVGSAQGSGGSGSNSSSPPNNTSSPKTSAENAARQNASGNAVSSTVTSAISEGAGKAAASAGGVAAVKATGASVVWQK
jgi:hypothetical protein